MPPSRPKKGSKPVPIVERRYFGIVEQRDGDTATLLPLYGRTPDALRWEELSKPELTTWESADMQAVPGSLWTFNVEPVSRDVSENGDEDPGANNYRVPTAQNRSPAIAAEVFFEKPIDNEPRRSSRTDGIELERHWNRGLATAERILDDFFLELEAIRRRYIVDGVPLDYEAQPRIYIGVRECFALGPFTFSRGEQGLWRATAESKVNILQPLRTSLYEAISVRGLRRTFINPNAILPQHLAFADFRDDSVIFTEFVERLNDNPSQPADENDALRRLSRHRQIDEGNQLFLYQRLRLNDAIDALLSGSVLRSNVEQQIVSLPSVRFLVDENIEKARVEIRARINDELADARAEIESELDSRRTQLKLLSEEVEGASLDVENSRRELEQLSTECRDKKAELARLRDDLPVAIDERIIRIAASVTERLIPIVNEKATPIVLSDTASIDEGLPPNVVGPSYPFITVTSCPELEDAADATRALNKASRSVGVCEEASSIFLACLIGGRIPVIFGPAAETLTTIAGQILFGGRCLRRTVSQQFVEFSDLFGRLSVAHKAFYPDVEGCADLLITAPDRRLHSIVFDGFNRGSESVFTPLMSHLSAPTRSKLPILRRGLLRNDDPYSKLADILWPDTIVRNRLILYQWESA